MKPSQQSKASAWDDGGGWEAEPDGVEELNFEDLEKPHHSFSKGAINHPKHNQVDPWGDVQEAEVDYSSLNLNKLSTEEIAKHKKKMDKMFDKNFVKPNDPNFVYDKRMHFKPPAKVDVEDSWEWLL